MPIGQSNSNTAGNTLQGAAPQPKKQGTGFTNLQKVIGANKGNQLGTAVQQGAQNRVGQVQNALGQAKSDFTAGVQGNRVDTEENEQFVAGAITDPNAAASNDDSVKKFQGFMQGGYKGPTGIENIGSIKAQANEAASFGGQAGSAEGRQALLQRYAGGNNYNAGQQRLDNLLLGQTGQGALKQVRRDSANLQGQVNSAVGVAQEQSNAAAGANKAFGQSINARLGRVDDPTTPGNEADSNTAFGSIQNNLSKRLFDYNKQQQSLYDSLKGSDSNLALNQEAMDAFGVQDGQKVYNTNLSSFVQDFNPSNNNVQRIASDDEYSRYMALSKLSGKENSLLYDPSMANTTQGVKVDKDNLTKTLAQKDTDYNNLINNNLAGLTNATANTWRYANDTDDTRVSSQVKTVDDARALLDAYNKNGSRGVVYDQLTDFIGKYDILNPNRSIGTGKAVVPTGGFGSGKVPKV